MIGEVAGGFNKTGDQNVYIGNLSGYLNSAGNDNTFVGDSAGRAVTSSNNTMIGSKSGASSTSAVGNTFLGANQLLNNTTGSYKTAIRYMPASLIIATATGNTALGFSTGTLIQTVHYNTFIGYDADATAAGFHQQHSAW